LLKYFPFIETVATYQKRYFRRDTLAALTVAVVALPQSTAYAVIAGVDPVCGLYSAIAFQNGGVTRMVGVMAGAAVLVILIFLAPYAKYIPSAALAGVIMVVAYSEYTSSGSSTSITPRSPALKLLRTLSRGPWPTVKWKYC